MGPAKCTKCAREMECMSGESAHPSNWYCQPCDDKLTQAQNKKMFDCGVGCGFKWVMGENGQHDCTIGLIRKARRLEDKLAKIAEILHYPECWDTMAYPDITDAIFELFCCNPNECKQFQSPPSTQ